MKTTPIITLLLLVLGISVLLLGRWFDKRYSVPFLTTIMKYKKPVYRPNLIGIGLLAAGGGLLIYTLVGWLWPSLPK